jgi:thiol:disulfide interchange protein DsbC
VKHIVPALLLFLSLSCIRLAAGAPLDLDKAIKIGSGKVPVIEYTDPDCPYCRKGSAFFRSRRDVTRYIFLNPLAIHPQAKEKAQYILSASDKAKAYEEVMSGQLDGKQLSGINGEGIKLLEEHQAIAKEAKVDSTPTFVICGRIIEGFDQRKLEAALGK